MIDSLILFIDWPDEKGIYWGMFIKNNEFKCNIKFKTKEDYEKAKYKASVGEFNLEGRELYCPECKD